MRRPTKNVSYCGKRDATTQDHVPPKGIFPEPRPTTLVTVPACFHCNNGPSRHDERFRNYLSLHVGSAGQRRSRLFDKTLSSLKRNRRLLDEVLNSSKEVPITTPTGVFAGTGLKILWDSKAHDSVIERCIRGLYYHHFGSVIADQARVTVQWLPGAPFTPDLGELTLVSAAETSSNTTLRAHLTSRSDQYGYSTSMGAILLPGIRSHAMAPNHAVEPTSQSVLASLALLWVPSLR